uniref:O-methyltransferase domain-containing protein n=1 Tax=Bionectria ochroleuca TaxID=29856 RepID=A0A8H7K9W8_BIOOC
MAKWFNMECRQHQRFSATKGSGRPYPGTFKTRADVGLHEMAREFQILAYIPSDQRAGYADLTDLTGVPEIQIRRIVRTTATIGLLCEPQPNYVAHTPLSIQFLKRPSLFDALMFATDTIIPTSQSMAEATRQEVEHSEIIKSPFQIATHFSSALPVACKADTRLLRRSCAFQRLDSLSKAKALTKLLSPIDWEGLGQATVVEINAGSTVTARALSERNHSVRFILQLSQDTARKVESNNFIIESRSLGAPQHQANAALYLLHLPDALLFSSSADHAEASKAELRAHLDVLRANEKATLILITEILPESGTASSPVESTACMKDLLLMQMGHRETLDLGRLGAMLESVREDADQLTIVNKFMAPDYPLLAFELRARSPSAG